MSFLKVGKGAQCVQPKADTQWLSDATPWCLLMHRIFFDRGGGYSLASSQWYSVSTTAALSVEVLMGLGGFPPHNGRTRTGDRKLYRLSYTTITAADW